MSIGRRHTKATKRLARNENRKDRAAARHQLRFSPDEVELRQPRGRAVWLSY